VVQRFHDVLNNLAHNSSSRLALLRLLLMLLVEYSLSDEDRLQLDLAVS